MVHPRVYIEVVVKNYFYVIDVDKLRGWKKDSQFNQVAARVQIIMGVHEYMIKSSPALDHESLSDLPLVSLR